MEQKDLEKIVKIIFDNSPVIAKQTQLQRITVSIKAVEKTPEIKIIYDYEPKLFPLLEPACDTVKNEYWKQPCSTSTKENHDE